MFDSGEKLTPLRRKIVADGIVRRRNESGENQLKIAAIIGEARKLGQIHGLRSPEAKAKSEELDPIYAREARIHAQVLRVEKRIR